MLLVAADGRIQQMNLRAERLFGYASDELTGHSMEVLLPDHVRERHRHVYRAAYVRDPVTKPMDTGREFVMRRKDGSAVTVEVSLAPLGSDTDGIPAGNQAFNAVPHLTVPVRQNDLDTAGKLAHALVTTLDAALDRGDRRQKPHWHR